MPTYYEILEMPPTATTAEIETALEARYHQWRRLVTHHDPNVVNQANQALQRLETIRVTLTHPERRAAYDAQIRKGQGTMGGLGDPSAATPQVVPAPLPAPVSEPDPQPVNEAMERVDAWVCPECQRVNAPGSAYCKQCGHTIGRPCPKCGAMVEISAVFCSHCGVNIANAARQKELEAALAAKQRALETASYPIPDRAEEIKKLRRTAISTGAWLTWAATGLFWLYANSSPMFQPYPLVVLGIQVIVLMGLAIFQRAFSFSAFLAGLCIVADFVLGGGVIYHRTLYTFYILDPISMVVLGVYTLALLNIGARLRFYGRGMRLLVWLALLARVVSLPLYLAEPIFSDVWSTMEEALGAGIVVLQSAELPLLLDGIQVGVLSVLMLRAWWLAQHFAHEVAAARLAQRQEIERLEHEIGQITRELQSLEKGI
jgi:ribosomal protein L40E